MLRLYALLFSFSIFLLSSCKQEVSTNTLLISGSSTVAPIANEVAKQYEALHPGTRINVQTGGSSKGLNDVSHKIADIGMSSRALTEREKTRLMSHTIARDGVAIVLHQNNPVQSLSFEQVQKIYRKEIKNWRELGGKDQEIVVVNKAAGRATLKVFANYFQLSNKEIKADIIIGDNEHAIKTLLASDSAIAYVSIGTAEYHISNKQPLKLLDADGIGANSQNVANGKFPISRPLILATNQNKNALVDDFITFFNSPKAKELIQSLHFVPATN